MESIALTSQQAELVGRIYEQFLGELKLYFLAYTHNEMEAEDMAHNLFMKVLRVDLIVESTVRCLLFTTAHRMIIDDVRHKYYVRQAEQRMKDGMELACPTDVYDRMERSELLALEERKLRTMPKKRASAYRMWRDEMSMKEIAEALHISRRTAEAHVYHATCEMKEFFRKAV